MSDVNSFAARGFDWRLFAGEEVIEDRLKELVIRSVQSDHLLFVLNRFQVRHEILNGLKELLEILLQAISMVLKLIQHTIQL